jgi:hypothetical protein
MKHKSSHQPTQTAGRQPMHPNLAFKRAAQILLTDECIRQIEDLADELSNTRKQEAA